MLTLIVAVFLALGFAFLATQNTLGVTLRAGNTVFTNIPLYIVVLGSLLLGLFVSWILSTVDWVANALTLRGKDTRLHQADSTIEALKRDVRKLELENRELRGKKEVLEPHDEHTHDVIEEKLERKPSFFDRFRQPRIA